MFKPYKEINPFNKRKKPEFKYSDGTKHTGAILDEIELEHIAGKKIYKYLIQKIKWYRENISIEFRFCYYLNDLNDPEKEWIFGRSALTLTPEEFNIFIKKMREKGWI